MGQQGSLGLVELLLVLRRRLELLEEAGPSPTVEQVVIAFISPLLEIDALAAVGRRDEALEIFSNVLSCRNHFGLLSEDIDPTTGELWGNFPQTYSQVGLILCAMRLSRSWEEGLWRAS